MAVDKKITPTLTLAQLYDAQKQYFDAFTIYNKLYQTNPSPDIKDRMEAVEKKIFSDMSLSYNEVIGRIFTEEDKAKFKILPEENHQKLKQAMKEDETETTEFVEEDFEEDENDMSDAEEIEIEYPNIPAYQAEVPISEPNSATFSLDDFDKDTKTSDITNFTISELAQFLIKKVNKDKKISDLTLKEIKEIKKLFKEIM